MSDILKLEMVVAAIILLAVTLFIIRSENLSVKYSMVWLFSGFLILFFSLFPNSLKVIANQLGFELVSNMIFLIMIGILFLITMSLTIIVTHQKEQIKLLIQELSNLKKGE
ncbi:MAG: DUF2304 domain-containing protein [Bacilli bacterium]|nr:DUF2304 domain-containing protein [Bacilli bacterium]MDD4706017.1 DUF2304 domain-containing protein [Bacilli bacterium]